MPKLLYVQQLRGIAILSVILFHLEPDFFSGGYVGIDLFLFVSGLVLFPSLRNIAQSSSAKSMFLSGVSFAKRRFQRLFPSFFIFTALSLPILLVLVPVGKDLSLSLQQLVSAYLLSANISAAQVSSDYFSHYPNLFLHLWSLSYEEQIYILALLLIFLIYPVKVLRKFTLLIIVITFIALSISSDYPNNSYYSFSFRLWEFAIGLIFGNFLSRTTGRIQLAKGQTRILIVLLLAVMLVEVSDYHIFRLLIVISIASVVLLIDESPRQQKDWLARAGDRSYVLYLFHYPPLVFVKHYIPAQPPLREGYVLFALVLSLLVSEIVFRSTESRVLNGTLWEKLSNKKKARSALLLSGVFMFLLCSLSWIANEYRFFGFNRHDISPRFLKELSGCDITNSFDTPCKFGEGEKTIALVGDSHASVLAPVFKEVSKELGFQLHVLAYKGCKYVNPSTLPKTSNLLLDRKCQNRNNMVDLMLRKNRYEKVFFSFRSQDCSINDFAGLCGDTLTNLIIQSLASEDEAILFTPVPEFTDVQLFPPRRLFEPYREATRTFPRTKILNQVKIDTRLIETKLPTKHITTIDSFCRESICLRRALGEWLWIDSNHLSQAGASRLANSIKMNMSGFRD